MPPPPPISTPSMPSRTPQSSMGPSSSLSSVGPLVPEGALGDLFTNAHRADRLLAFLAGLWNPRGQAGPGSLGTTLIVPGNNRGIQSIVKSFTLYGSFPAINFPMALIWLVNQGVNDVQVYVQFPGNSGIPQINNTQALGYPSTTSGPGYPSCGLAYVNMLWLAVPMMVPLQQSDNVSVKPNADAAFTLGRAVAGVITFLSDTTSTTNTGLSGVFAAGAPGDTRAGGDYSPPQLAQISLTKKDAKLNIKVQRGIAVVQGPDIEPDFTPINGTLVLGWGQAGFIENVLPLGVTLVGYASSPSQPYAQAGGSYSACWISPYAQVVANQQSVPNFVVDYSGNTANTTAPLLDQGTQIVIPPLNLTQATNPYIGPFSLLESAYLKIRGGVRVLLNGNTTNGDPVPGIRLTSQIIVISYFAQANLELNNGTAKDNSASCNLICVPEIYTLDECCNPQWFAGIFPNQGLATTVSEPLSWIAGWKQLCPQGLTAGSNAHAMYYGTNQFTGVTATPSQITLCSYLLSNYSLTSVFKHEPTRPQNTIWIGTFVSTTSINARKLDNYAANQNSFQQSALAYGYTYWNPKNSGTQTISVPPSSAAGTTMAYLNTPSVFTGVMGTFTNMDVNQSNGNTYIATNFGPGAFVPANDTEAIVVQPPYSCIYQGVALWSNPGDLPQSAYKGSAPSANLNVVQGAVASNNSPYTSSKYESVAALPYSFITQITLIAPRLYDPPSLGPARVVRWENLARGQSVQVEGTLWYEAIPSSAIAPYYNSAQNMPECAEPAFVDIARVLANGDNSMFNRVYTLDEYRTACDTFWPALARGTTRSVFDRIMALQRAEPQLLAASTYRRCSTAPAAAQLLHQVCMRAHGQGMMGAPMRKGGKMSGRAAGGYSISVQDPPQGEEFERMMQQQRQIGNGQAPFTNVAVNMHNKYPMNPPGFGLSAAGEYGHHHDAGENYIFDAAASYATNGNKHETPNDVAMAFGGYGEAMKQDTLVEEGVAGIGLSPLETLCEVVFTDYQTGEKAHFDAKNATYMLERRSASTLKRRTFVWAPGFFASPKAFFETHPHDEDECTAEELAKRDAFHNFLKLLPRRLTQSNAASPEKALLELWNASLLPGKSDTAISFLHSMCSQEGFRVVMMQQFAHNGTQAASIQVLIPRRRFADLTFVETIRAIALFSFFYRNAKDIWNRIKTDNKTKLRGVGFDKALRGPLPANLNKKNLALFKQCVYDLDNSTADAREVGIAVDALQ